MTQNNIVGRVIITKVELIAALNELAKRKTVIPFSSVSEPEIELKYMGVTIQKKLSDVGFSVIYLNLIS